MMRYGTLSTHLSQLFPNSFFNMSSSFFILAAPITSIELTMTTAGARASHAPHHAYTRLSRSHAPADPCHKAEPRCQMYPPAYAGCRTTPYGPLVTSACLGRSATWNVKCLPSSR